MGNCNRLNFAITVNGKACIFDKLLLVVSVTLKVTLPREEAENSLGKIKVTRKPNFWHLSFLFVSKIIVF